MVSIASITIDLPISDIADICQRFQVQKLSLFGSALTDEFRAGSDLDFLVLFQPGAEIGFLAMAAMQRELGDLLDRPVDLVSKHGLNRFIRDEVISTASANYGEEWAALPPR